MSFWSIRPAASWRSKPSNRSTALVDFTPVASFARAVSARRSATLAAMFSLSLAACSWAIRDWSWACISSGVGPAGGKVSGAGPAACAASTSGAVACAVTGAVGGIVAPAGAPDGTESGGPLAGGASVAGASTFGATVSARRELLSPGVSSMRGTAGATPGTLCRRIPPSDPSKPSTAPPATPELSRCDAACSGVTCPL